MNLRLLRIFLGLAAITWGAAIPGVFLNWELAVSAMHGLGATTIEYDPMLDYWLRMASAGFGLIAGMNLLPALQPLKFQAFIPWLGFFSLAVGIILLTHGIRLNLGPWPFIGDVSACLLAGGGILYSWWKARFKLASGNAAVDRPQ